MTPKQAEAAKNMPIVDMLVLDLVDANLVPALEMQIDRAKADGA